MHLVQEEWGRSKAAVSSKLPMEIGPNVMLQPVKYSTKKRVAQLHLKEFGKNDKKETSPSPPLKKRMKFLPHLS
ncbi:hypothetical protein AWJ19_19450 [Paenibacillus sp. DMB5]|nr:hypothetical protein AWJ19_19450 [Paenibacillus sp. DMB5]